MPVEACALNNNNDILTLGLNTNKKKSLASLKRFTATVVNLLLLGTRVLASANVHKLSLEDAPGILTVLRRNMISPVSPTRPPPS